MIDHARGLVFVHIPKCGGLSVERALGGLPPDQHAMQHWGAELLARHCPQAWRDYRRFAIVRHPVARAWSFVRFLRRHDPVWRHRLRDEVADAELLGDLLQGHNLLTRATPHRMLPASGPAAGWPVEIVPLETLDRWWPGFARDHELPALPRINAAPDPAPPVPDWVRLAVEAAFPECFDRFGYLRSGLDADALDPQARGRVAWTALHAWAQRQDDDATPGQVMQRQRWLGNWVLGLPDALWRERWAEAVVARPPPMAEGRALLAWSEDIHEDLRLRLGQRPWQPWRP